MANQATAFFYWYRRYKVRAADMTAFQQAMVESVRGLGEGAFGASVLRGFDVSIGSGLLLDIGPGIAQAASGFLQVLSSSGAVDATSATGGLPTRSLVVARATPVDANFIPSPTSPFSPVPLNSVQTTTLVVIPGAPAQTPEYPAKGANDTILAGLMLPPGVTQITSAMLDFEVREVAGANSLIQKNMGHQDDRLRPFRSSSNSLGVKSSQTSGSGPKLFSYPSKSTPSLFPLTGGAHLDSDSFVNFSTGVISGGDGTTPAFTPTIPSGNQSVVCAVSLNTDDTMAFAYGNPGTLAQCLDAIAQQTTAGAGGLPNTGGLYPIAYVIVSAYGGVFSDIQVIDSRPVGGGGGGGGAAPVFENESIGTGNGTNTIFNLSKKPKDSQSVLLSGNGKIYAGGFTVVGQTVTFTAAPPKATKILAFYVAEGPSSISGHSEQPSGVPNGSLQLFGISIPPVDQASCLVFVNGRRLDPSVWSLIQSVGGSYIFFNQGYVPPAASQLWLFCLVNVIAAGLLPTPSTGYKAFGSRLSPVLFPASGLTPTTDMLQHWFVWTAASGAQPASGGPQQLAPGTHVGMKIRLTVIDGAASGFGFPVLSDGMGLTIEGVWPNPYQPVDAKTIEMGWDGAFWSEDNRR